MSATTDDGARDVRTEVRVGHVLDMLRGLEAGRFQCVVTSPPYFNLRVYHTDPQVWGDGWRGELGAEPEPALYVAHLLEVFAEVKRVLRDDGCAFVNIGDSYASRTHDKVPERSKNFYTLSVKPTTTDGRPGVPAKSLCLIPQRLIIALAEQGWIPRNEIIWHKPNAMPTSAKDRFKCAHEKLFLLVKRQKYKFRLEAVLQPVAESNLSRVKYGWTPNPGLEEAIAPGRDRQSPPVIREDGLANPGDVWRIASQPRSEDHFAAFPDDLAKRCILASTDPGDEVLDPFVGRGTTVIVAQQLGRVGTGIELNPEYAALAEANIRREASQEILSLNEE